MLLIIALRPTTSNCYHITCLYHFCRRTWSILNDYCCRRRGGRRRHCQHHTLCLQSSPPSSLIPYNHAYRLPARSLHTVTPSFHCVSFGCARRWVGILSPHKFIVISTCTIHIRAWNMCCVLCSPSLTSNTTNNNKCYEFCRKRFVISIQKNIFQLAWRDAKSKSNNNNKTTATRTEKIISCDLICKLYGSLCLFE